MGFYVLGLNYKECPVEIRERLHFSSSKLQKAFELSEAHSDLAEIVILSTCNRVEIYGYTENEEMPIEPLFDLIERVHEISRSVFTLFLYRYESKKALLHLFRVASGLDSLVIGENEILGQIRDAFRASVNVGKAHGLLYKLMEKALRIGKEVRTKTKINEGATSIPSVAVELAEKIFGRLQGEKIMVLGTGEMAGLTLSNLKTAGADALYVVSRSQERGRKLAGDYAAEWIPLESWEQYLPQVDILIASTSAPHPIVHYDQVKAVMAQRKHRPLFLIDIAVPRDIDPQINSLEDVYLYNIDDLKSVSASNLRLRRHEIAEAEAVTEQAVEDYESWVETLQARPTLEKMESFIEEILESEIERLFPGESIPLEKKNELRRRIRAKLMHRPNEKIKEASQTGGVHKYLEALRSLFQLDDEKKPLKTFPSERSE